MVNKIRVKPVCSSGFNGFKEKSKGFDRPSSKVVLRESANRGIELYERDSYDRLESTTYYNLKKHINKKKKASKQVQDENDYINNANHEREM